LGRQKLRRTDELITRERKETLPVHLFNVAKHQKTIFYKSLQILAYADDIDIIGRTQSAMIEAFTRLEKAAKDLNLFINQEKTKICQ
jgi:hypothetical protein